MRISANITLAHSYTDSDDFTTFWYTVTGNRSISYNICTLLQGLEGLRETFANSYRDAKGSDIFAHPYKELAAFPQVQVEANMRKEK